MNLLASIASSKALLARLSVLALVTLPLAPPASPPLYMPRSVARAYHNGTRSMDGRPGPKYWQNRGRYSIAITALPPDRSIRGSEQITYFNLSLIHI